MNLVFEYINYRWNAKGRHGIHSPFVYDLLDKGFKILPSENYVKARNELFVHYKTSSKVIEVADFGAGSKYFDKNRKVRDIFKRSASRGKKGVLLRQLTQHFKTQNVLEMGTSLGIGTFSMAYEQPTCFITTVEACANTRLEASEQFEKFNLLNVQSLNCTFDQFFDSYDGPKFDLVFVDGHHDGGALLRYLDKLDSITHDETIFVLDDIRWSDSMKTAFDDLVKSENYHVTMDLFQVGIIVKRHHQRKEHFVLKWF